MHQKWLSLTSDIRLKAVSLYSTSEMEMFFPLLSTHKVWADINTFFVSNIVQEIHFKMLHRHYPCNIPLQI